MILRSLFPNRVYGDIIFDLILLCGSSYAVFQLKFHPMAWFFIGLFFVRLYFDVLEYFIFQRPEKFRKQSLQLIGWESQIINVNSYNIQYHFRQGHKDKPLIFFLHGWRSSSGRMTNRIQQFLDLDWSICAADLPNHGGSDAVKKWSADFSTTCIIEILKSIDASQRNKQLVIYGHSIGAFITIRLCKRKNEWLKNMNLEALILESPMTKYSYILDRTYRYLSVPKFLQPVLTRRIFSTVNRLHTVSADFNSIQEADIPMWGMPICPVLVVQAETDTQLGRFHYNDLLIELKTSTAVDAESHLISSLSHSGGDDNIERSTLIEIYLKKIKLC
jgi:pimeloyl-ACP methyl ester carboxylesterase